MHEMTLFFYDVMIKFFEFADSAILLPGLSLLDFTIGLFLINLVVVNFIILAKRYNNSSRPGRSGSGSSSKGEK